jgi:hypothetical protein
MTNNNSNTGEIRKNTYHTPQLVVYGNVKNLTMSGSGSTLDNQAQANMFEKSV